MHKKNGAKSLLLKLILRQSLIKFSGLHVRNVSYGSSTNCYIICYPLAASYSSDSLLIHLSVSSAKMLKKLYYTCFGIAPKSRTTALMYRDGFIPASHIVLI